MTFLKLAVTGALCAIGSVQAQTPPAANPRPITRPTVYPTHPPADPVTLERGKAIYGVNCNFCHGSDARGGEGGPNLLRSEIVLNDVNGELIGPVILNGRGEMPKINLSQAQIADVAVFLHDFKVGGYDISRMTPPSILVGDAKAGEAYFQKTCVGCHSVEKDLKGIGSRFTDAKMLQNLWLAGGGGGRGGRGGGRGSSVPPTTVTVSFADGKKAEGRLVRVDDFFVTLVTADNAQRTIRRDRDTPKVVIHDPLQPHKDLLAKYTDTDIHNVTAFLAGVK